MVYYNVRWKDEFIAIVIKMYCFMIVLIKYMIDGLNGKSTIEGHFIPKPLDKKTHKIWYHSFILQFFPALPIQIIYSCCVTTLIDFD